MKSRYWIPAPRVGFFAGVNWFHVDAQDAKDVDFNLDLVGPQFGVEVRF